MPWVICERCGHDAYSESGETTAQCEHCSTQFIIGQYECPSCLEFMWGDRNAIDGSNTRLPVCRDCQRGFRTALHPLSAQSLASNDLDDSFGDALDLTAGDDEEDAVPLPMEEPTRPTQTPKAASVVRPAPQKLEPIQQHFIYEAQQPEVPNSTYQSQPSAPLVPDKEAPKTLNAVEKPKLAGNDHIAPKKPGFLASIFGIKCSKYNQRGFSTLVMVKDGGTYVTNKRVTVDDVHRGPYGLGLELGRTERTTYKTVTMVREVSVYHCANCDSYHAISRDKEL